MEYTGRKTARIKFPLGGIGTGCIALAGNGSLLDWEIFNRPNKNTYNGFSHFAVRAESDGRVLDARVLHGDLQPPYDLAFYGTPRETLAGMPHFQNTSFEGEFPLAKILFEDRSFPGQVSLSAFNPFIPHNEKDSGIPAAFFEIEIHNSTRRPIDYSVVGAIANPIFSQQEHRIEQVDGITILRLAGKEEILPAKSANIGDICIATDAELTSWQHYWFRGEWFDSLEVYWKDLLRPGKLKDRLYRSEDSVGFPASAGLVRTNHGSLASHVRIGAGQKKRVRFIIAWNFPFHEKYWNDSADEEGGGARNADKRPQWKNYYATQWENSRASAKYALQHWETLFFQTKHFHDLLFASSLPAVAIDAVSANLAVLKSPTVLRLTDGTFWAWEGCADDIGSCSGTCSHVWNYGQSLAFLFPSLERSVREADYKYNQQPDGGMPFRLPLPLGTKHPGGRSCADGLFGSILAVYRDWKLSGDTEWLHSIWPEVQKSLVFAWSPANEDRWDPEKTGVLWGRQHHTLDIEMFGPSSWLVGFYLAALKASAEMAEHLGDFDSAAEYREILRRGQRWVDANLFNGEYFHQHIDLTDKTLVDRFNVGSYYWNEEHGEIKYQIGEGCMIDQVLGQWHADLYGVGDVFDSAKVRKALKAIYRNNYRKEMRGTCNPCRLYALNDEGGVMICTWPNGSNPPAIPLTYAQETMHGFEYALASHMIWRGLVNEGVSIVKSIRDRYDGERRNPWNEIECGYNYARSTASYALLLAFSGFSFDMSKGCMGFSPAENGKPESRFFWSTATAYGEVILRPNYMKLSVSSGQLELSRIEYPGFGRSKSLRIVKRGRLISGACDQDGISFARKVSLKTGDRLVMETQMPGLPTVKSIPHEFCRTDVAETIGSI